MLHRLTLGSFVFLVTATALHAQAVLVDINADGTARNATLADFEAAMGLTPGQLTGNPVTHFPNNEPGGGMFSQTVGGVTVEFTAITNDADNWFGAGSDNNLLDDGLFLRTSNTSQSETGTLSGFDIDPNTMYELFLFAGRSQGHETEVLFNPSDPEDPTGGIATMLDPPVVGGDNTLGTAKYEFTTGATPPGFLAFDWTAQQNVNGNQDAVFSGFALVNAGRVPEPASVAIWALLGLGSFVYFGWRRRKRIAS